MATEMSSRLILLMRHARCKRLQPFYPPVPDDDSTNHQIKLTKEGEEQTDEVGERLSQILREDQTLRIAAVVCPEHSPEADATLERLAKSVAGLPAERTPNKALDPTRFREIQEECHFAG